MNLFQKFALCGALALFPVAAQAQAQEGEAPAQTPEEARAAVQRGVSILRSFNVAMNSDQLTAQTRGQIFACMYRNPIRRISNAAAQIIDNNPGLEHDNPSHVYAAAIRACGITLRRTDAPDGEPGAPGDAPQGR